MDANQQAQQPQAPAQNTQMQNMMQMPPQPNGGQPRPGQGFPQGQPNPGFMVMPENFQQNPAQYAQMMQQMQAAGQGQPGFFQQRPGQPGMPGAPQPNSQYRAKQSGAPGGPGFQGQPPQHMGRGGMQGMMGMPLSMQGVPGALIEVGTKMQGLMNGGAGGQGQPGGGPKQKRDPTHSLYIGNLPDTMYDLDLYKFFHAKQYKLKNARVMFDEANRSKRFGYLNFHDASEAQRCLAEQNNVIINGKQIVLNKQKDREFDSQANLLVRNLPKSLDQRGLAEMFKSHGKIGSCKLEIYGDGTSRGFGYVQFDSPDDAKKAIEALNEKVIDGQKISVVVHSKRDERETQAERYTNLFLQNLPSDFTTQKLRDLFAQYGEIASLEMGSKTGHGYVSYKNHEDAKKALDAVNMKLKLEDKTILCSPHIYKKESDLQPKGSNLNPIVQNQKEMFKSNIYVRFIPKHVTKDELEAEFSRAGVICSTRMKPFEMVNQIDGTKFTSYQIAYVLYQDVKDAQKCIRLFDSSRPFGLNYKPLKVDFWQAKEDLKNERDEKSQNYIRQILNLCKTAGGRPGYMDRGGMGGAPGAPGMMQGGYPNQGFQQMGQDGQPQQQMGGHHGGFRQGGRGGYNQNHRGGNRGRGGRGQHHGGRGGMNKGQRGGYNNNQQHQQNPQQMQMQQNQGMPMPPQQQQMQAPASSGQLMMPKVDASQLDKLTTAEDRENFVGNSIYNAIHQAFGEQEAPTITGMILDESAVDYKELLTNPQYFVTKVNEARSVFKNSQAQEQMKQQPGAPAQQQ